AIIIAGMGLFTDAYDLFSISLVLKTPCPYLLRRTSPTKSLHTSPPPSSASPLLGTSIRSTPLWPSWRPRWPPPHLRCHSPPHDP
ncbi:hypothetical protein Ancab_034982, partial [Ancistrocladus abbreviatus]